MKKKRIVALLCAGIMLSSCIYPMEGSVLVQAADLTQVDSNGITWEYEVMTTADGSYAKITDVELSSGTTKVNIPSKLGSYTVKEIDSAYKSLFYENTELTTVSIPSTVTTIGTKAFYHCTALEKVTFASENSKERVLTIGSAAFSGCSRLREVGLPEGLAELKINSEAFDSCQNLGISEFSCQTSIGMNAFYNCDFTNVVFKEDVTIGGSAFGRAFKEEDQVKKTIVFEKNVSMGAYQCNAPLAYNPGLTEITFCGDVNLCEGAFQNDINLEKITWGTKLEGIYASYNTLMGQQVFSGCEKLKTFAFQKFDEDVSVSFENFYGSFPELDTVIYEGDVTTNYWINAKNVIFKGHVNISKELSVSSSITKNIYCHQWDVDFTNLKANNINFYGILPNEKATNSEYKLKSYVESQTGSILKNIVSRVNVTNVSTEYGLGDKSIDELTLTPKDLDLEVTVNYVNGSQKEAEIISEGNGYNGYLFSYGTLAADLNNDFTVSYSNLQDDFQVLIAYPKLVCIIVEMKKSEINTSKQVTVLEGENQLKKEDIIVTAVYDDGTYEDVTDADSCVILPHTIVVGDDNTVMVKYTNPENNQFVIGSVQVTGSAKSEAKIIRGTYKYQENQEGVLVNTAIKNEQFEVYQLYDNGTEELLDPDQYTISTTVIDKLGDNVIVIETKDTKRKTTVNVNGIGLGSLSVDYIGGKKAYGDSLTLSDLDVVAVYKNGEVVSSALLQEDVHILPEILTEDVVKDGYATVQVTYADRIAEIQVPVTKVATTATPVVTKEPVQTEIAIATEDPDISETLEPSDEKEDTPNPTGNIEVPITSQTPATNTSVPNGTTKPTETTEVAVTATPVATVGVTESNVPSGGVDADIAATPDQNMQAEIQAFENTKPVLSVESLGVKYKLSWKWNGQQTPDKYILYYSIDNKDYKILKTVDGTVNSYKYSNDAALMGTKVYFRVMAQKEIGGSNVSSQISSKVGKCLLDPVKEVNIYSKNHKLYMTWERNKKCSGYLVTLTVKYNNKLRTKKIRITSKKKNHLVLTLKQLQKKFKVRSGAKISIVKWSVQSYYKSGKTYAYSEKVG